MIVSIHPPCKELGMNDYKWGISSNGKLSIASTCDSWFESERNTDDGYWKIIWRIDAP